MSHQGPYQAFPPQQPPGFGQSAAGGYPPAQPGPYQQPVSGGYPQYQANPGTGQFGAAPPVNPSTGRLSPAPPAKSRKTLYLMISVCVVLAVAFGSTAYFIFFSGDSTQDVVADYIGYAQDGDFDKARELACKGAADGITFRLEAEAMDAMRRWFNREDMTWKVREELASGKKSTLILDKTLNLPNYDAPIDQRWDYRLKRQSASWCIDSAKIMTIVDSNIGGPGDCVEANGFQYESADCGEASSDEKVLFVVADSVEKPENCPDPKGLAAETTDHQVLCLEEDYQRY